MSHSQLQVGFAGQNEGTGATAITKFDVTKVPGCSNYLSTAWIKKNGGTPVTLIDTSLKDGTVTVAIFDDGVTCLREVQS
jgi:hypothetical protein